MTDEERAHYETLVASLIEAVKAKEALILDLERENAALRARLAGGPVN